MRRHIDYPLLAIVVGFLAAGLLMISSASIVLSEKNFGTPYYYVSHQAIAALGGLIALGFFQAVPYRFWKRIALPLLLVSLAVTAAVFFPQVGVATKGAVRWLNLGFGTIQPSEILKLSLILYLASWLEKKRGGLHGFAASFVPFLIVLGRGVSREPGADCHRFRRILGQRVRPEHPEVQLPPRTDGRLDIRHHRRRARVPRRDDPHRNVFCFFRPGDIDCTPRTGRIRTPPRQRVRVAHHPAGVRQYGGHLRIPPAHRRSAPVRELRWDRAHHHPCNGRDHAECVEDGKQVVKNR